MTQKPKKPLNPFIRFTTIALQMGLTIYLGSKLGEWLDIKFDNQDQLYYKIVTLCAVFIAIFAVIKQVINLTNKD
ncbi:AtpZ/AtpI family protein [Bizionia paragorgiae]|uniref:Putative F0F1-ATPase subunit Ca2+/Mg2+ transporter n=1 Tax=Bizionia paragorgiae TaxID=283786 RepID=A0A1H3W2H9_BIZPA|nr:AtpZ/AtpI family protein [Bizionia paragorgiae]MDX1270947.1 AtpZ/AtpI family protein [Bizionia paragorgiae]SDZ80532.1 Putative F0F1-ATPase subunit Ca2+/Mg2+ transporter [Bizionia paragorgiae]